jgi:tetratricopeptide (TPR) repeat protein
VAGHEAEAVSAAAEAISAALETVRGLERNGLNEIVAALGAGGGLEELQGTASSCTEQLAEMQAILNRLVERGHRESEYLRDTLRFSPDEVTERLAGLRGQQPQEAAVAWGTELTEALSRGEYDAACRFARDCPDIAASADLTPKDIADGIDHWRQGKAEAGADVARRLRKALSGKRWLMADTSMKLFLLAATAYYQAGRTDKAVRSLESASKALPQSATPPAEQAGLSLLLGQLDMAAARARQAVELEPGNPAGYFQLGACSEWAGDTARAAELYAGGCARSAILTLSRLGTGATFLRVTGLLHLARARSLAQLGRTEESLQAIEDALADGIAGTDPYPEAQAFELRVGLLDKTGQPHEAAVAALAAGQRYRGNGDNSRSLPLLKRAWNASPPIPDAGWYYADALRATSRPGGGDVPDPHLVEDAKLVWDEQAKRSGPPAKAPAWAYRVRAGICELEASVPGSDRAADYWAALVYAEKALVLNDHDPETWGLCMRLLRGLGLNSAALECANRGFALAPGNRLVLEGRLALLADRGQYAEAEEALNRITGGDGDPWVAGVRASLRYRQGHYEEAMAALSRPLAEGFDPGWSLDLRARCRLQQGEVAKARADLKQLLKVDSHPGWESTARRAIAHAALGDPASARQELDHGANGTPVSSNAWKAAAVAVLLASHDLPTARASAEECLATAANIREVSDALDTWRLCLALLATRNGDYAGEFALLEELDNLHSPERQPALSEDVAAEIARAQERHADQPPGSTARVALSAMAARRLLAESGDDQQAERILRDLEGTSFAPEAGFAINALLKRRLKDAVTAGNHVRAQELWDELRDRGADFSPSREVVTAAALAAKGRYQQAIEWLYRARDRVSAEAGAVAAIDQRIGEYELLLGNTGASIDAYRRALAAAETAENRLDQARLRVRLAIAFALRHEPRNSADCLAQALRGLHGSNVASPSLAVGHELAAAAAEATAERSALRLLSASLAEAIEETDPADRAGHDWLEAVLQTP